jgi:serine protease AprX
MGGKARAFFALCLAVAHVFVVSSLAQSTDTGMQPLSRHNATFPQQNQVYGQDPTSRQSSATAVGSKISPVLQAQLSTGEKATFLVVLTEQADLSHVRALRGNEAKGRAVYDALRAVAQRTQASLRAELDALGVAYRPYYVVNMLAVHGDVRMAQMLADRADVARLEANAAVRLDPPVDVQTQAAAPASVGQTEWGVERIGADDVWALGYTGQGVVVAGQDTGYEWDHPALRAQYRGWDGVSVSHDFNWHDAIHADDPNTPFGNPCGYDSAVPCDDYSHGTHTMGTIVGDDGAGNQIGVAPGARWIGCRNMEQGWGTPATYAECFEFFLAPYPVGGDPMAEGQPALAPHVINNSWSCPKDEGCDATSLRTVVENVRAAGIVVVVSAGNSGAPGKNGCGTVNAPPALHDASFSVGATDNADQIAGFSSRGPVTVDGSGRPKPDVSAPGIGVRSSVPGGGYGYKSGTSMAAPHVAGLVALLWSAAPSLIGDVDGTEQLIQETAIPRLDAICGGDADGHPNNVYGWGTVDALRSIQRARVGLSVEGRVEPAWVDAGSVATYTFVVTNRSVQASATGVVLTDTLALSTTFAGAGGSYTQIDDKVKWSLGTIGPGQGLSVTLSVTVAAAVPKGAEIVNADYGVRGNEVPTTVVGAPIVARVPWRYYFPIFYTRI